MGDVVVMADAGSDAVESLIASALVNALSPDVRFIRGFSGFYSPIGVLCVYLGLACRPYFKRVVGTHLYCCGVVGVDLNDALGRDLNKKDAKASRSPMEAITSTCLSLRAAGVDPLCFAGACFLC